MGAGVRIAKSLWDATAKGDRDGVCALLSPDIRWRNFSAGDLSGEIHGRDPVVALLARSGEIVDQLSSDLIDVFGSDEKAVIHYRVSAARDSRTLSTDILLVMDTEDGWIVDVMTTPMDAAANDLFWRSH
jgi:ketosteroid isomerase-like protein